ncbi:superoxide dismutase [Tessaracoccus sp. OH4464_COT-324]|uniref:superoxide dismutase n=1 Tax=Tessaracoccus sp. OH4464_COT-324 TaxID=2491059 RepID=UPI000F6356ED|nr:superoxide dismutase [Tessaracoccus sp. OH4464_COT-324]RRD45971.1 superoxide dismutase [Tessaracoccus sp. OH4464_COT-324]
MTYVLPDLDYDYGALAPHIAPEIMELHHGKHHAAYVAGLNAALEQLAEARAKGELGSVGKLAKDVAFNLGGHINHSVFWKNMSPDGGGRPEGELASAIDEFFGGFEGFQKQFNATATSIQGSGWAILAWDTLGGRLLVHQLYDQQNNLPASQLPLLQLDMWEHAFYLQYKNVKPDYVAAWWNVVNWADVAQRFEKARAAATALA